MFESFYQEYSPQEREIVVQLFPCIGIRASTIIPDYCEMTIRYFGNDVL